MSSHPTVSVVMPAYNMEAYIEEAICSVLSQTYQDWELLVVDDASWDETRNIVESFVAVDHRITLLRMPQNSGVAAARNKGIGAARGAYVALLDADDYWEPEKLSLQVSLAERADCEIVYCSYDFVSEQGEAIGTPFVVPERTNFDSMLISNVISCSTALIETELLTEHSFSSEFYHEDYHLWMRLLGSGATAVGDQSVLMHYRQHADSRSSNKGHAARERWRIYRKGLGLSIPVSLRSFVRYSFCALRKYRHYDRFSGAR